MRKSTDLTKTKRGTSQTRKTTTGKTTERKVRVKPMGKIARILSILALVILAGCNMPMKDYDLVRLDPNGFDTKDNIEFTLRMSEQKSYCIMLSTRISKNLFTPTLPVEITVTSPEGNITRQHEEIPTDDLIRGGVVKESAQNGTWDITWKWMDRFVPSESGEWKITLRIDRDIPGDAIDTIKGIYEIGINCRTNERKR
jgi:hypothetical protein